MHSLTIKNPIICLTYFKEEKFNACIKYMLHFKKTSKIYTVGVY